MISYFLTCILKLSLQNMPYDGGTMGYQCPALNGLLVKFQITKITLSFLYIAIKGAHSPTHRVMRNHGTFSISMSGFGLSCTFKK